MSKFIYSSILSILICIVSTTGAAVPTSGNSSISIGLVAGLSGGVIGIFIIAGFVASQYIRRRRQNKIISGILAGSNIQTAKELDTYIKTAIMGLTTEKMLRSQSPPSRTGLEDLMSLDFTNSER